MKKMNKKKTFVTIITLCLVCVGILMISKTAYAHRTWKKITKLPNGDYYCDSSIKESRPWWIKGIKLKIDKKYFTLNSSVEDYDTGKLYCSDPLKLRISKKCKFFFAPRSGAGADRKVTRSKALSYIKKENKKGKIYSDLLFFEVKNNKVIRVYLKK